MFDNSDSDSGEYSESDQEFPVECEETYIVDSVGGGEENDGERGGGHHHDPT